MVGKRSETGDFNAEDGDKRLGVFVGKSKAWGGMGPKMVVSSSCSFATNLIAPFVYSLVIAGGFQFHHPLLFFSFFLRW